MPTMIRYAEKAVSLDGAQSVTFPLFQYEWQGSGAMRPARTTIPGTNYAFDHLRNAITPRDVARESIRFMMGEDTVQATADAIDDLAGRLLAMGPFWLTTLGPDGTRRKARCRLASKVDILVSYRRSITAPAVLDIERYSDWFDNALQQHVEVLTATPTTFTVTNPGSMPAELMVIRFRSNGATGYTNPILENLTNGFEFRSLRDAIDANSELKLDTEEPSVRHSTDDGGTYADDFANYTLPSLQMPLSFRLDPGPNSIRYTNTGTPALNIEFLYYPVYANG